jgi:hypothetical protein
MVPGAAGRAPGAIPGPGGRAPGGIAPGAAGRAAAGGAPGAAGRAAAGAGAGAAAGAAGRGAAAGAKAGAETLPPVSSFTLLMSAWLSKGFEMWPSAWACRARASSNASKVPARRRTGVARSAASPFTASHSS